MVQIPILDFKQMGEVCNERKVPEILQSVFMEDIFEQEGK